MLRRGVDWPLSFAVVGRAATLSFVSASLEVLVLWSACHDLVPPHAIVAEDSLLLPVTNRCCVAVWLRWQCCACMGIAEAVCIALGREPECVASVDESQSTSSQLLPIVAHALTPALTEVCDARGLAFEA